MIDDDLLLEQLATEDRDSAFVDLYDRYANSLYGFAVRLVGDSASAEELVQACFVRIVNEAATFDATASSSVAHIVSTVRAAATEHCERYGDALRSGGASAIDRLLMVMAADMALQNLSPDRREILRLTFMENLRQRELATSADVPLSTVKTRSLEAMRELASVLRETAVA